MEQEIIVLLQRAVENCFEETYQAAGARPPHHDYYDDFFGSIAVAAYEAIWEYIVDAD